MKVHENLNEVECMLKYLEKLKVLWKFNEETYNCNLGVSVINPYHPSIYCVILNEIISKALIGFFVILIITDLTFEKKLCFDQIV